MTVVNPKSISGINSITMASGSDNLLTIHTTNTTERVRVNSDGDVIVGSGITVSPDGDIFATGVTTATTFVGALTGNVTGNATGLSGTPNISAGTIAGSTGTFTGDVDIADKIVHTGDTNTAIRFPSADTVSMEVAGSEGFKVDATGTTLTSTTDASLFINTTNSNGSHVRFQTSGTNKTFLGQAAGISGSLGGANDFAIRSAEDIVFSTNDNNTPNLKIDTSGRMSLGTTDASQFNAGADDFVIQGSGSCGITIDATSSSNSNIYFADGPTGSEAYRGYTQYQHSNDTFVFGRAGVDHLYLQNDGGTKNVLGNFIVGTSGRGLQFNASDSGSSELLDDYEEGTWTPTNSIGLTLTNSNPAYYLKIGKMVMIQFDVSFSGASDTAQCGAIQSLPFTAENTTNHFAQSPLPYISTNTGNNKLDTSHLENLLVFIAPGDDKVTIYSWVTSSLAARSLLVGRRIRHQMIYKAA